MTSSGVRRPEVLGGCKTICSLVKCEMFLLKIWNSGLGGDNLTIVSEFCIYFIYKSLNKISFSEFSIGFHLSYLNDLTRSSRKGLLFVTSGPRHIECSNSTKVRWVLKTHQLTNLWVIHFKERAFFWPCVRAPLQTANLFF